MFILKSFVYCFIPLIMALIFMFIFVIWKLIRWNKTELKWNIVVVLITVAFFMQPTLTQKAFSFLRCIDVYETNRLQSDLDVLCWKGSHIYWAACFGIPVLILCLMFPFSGIIWMLINWKWLHEENFKKYFVFFY